ncbi:chloride channel protein [Ferrimonas senticii]|uniref:chloride channel protein n=1 Tax=Ferrimonas senticii TaxID=394566 RepID=UPI000429579C|nr:chloride channel protein [Ferrimonas senticii]
MIADYKYRLATARLSVQLCFLGLLVGLLASGLIIAFELAVAQLQALLWREADDFTQLPQWMRVALPIGGAAAIAVMIHFSRRQYRRTGIAFVIHCIQQRYGRMPLGSGFNQFVTAILALISGFSVGREGPAVHIGASAATLIAKRWALPDNTMRILSSCGVAAGISAIFNTPLAGVIFVLEVILREYKVHYFLPITIAAMTASVASRLAKGDVHLYSDLELTAMPLSFYPLLVGFGLALGVLAAVFNRAMIHTTAHTANIPLTKRLLAAGVITAAIGMVIPQAMGGEHHVIDLAHQLDSTAALLGLLLLAKMALTIAAIGLGIPGGIIGPMYGIGALAGGALCLLLAPWIPELLDYQGTFAAITMTAMMAVSLNAPIAGLLALVELTNNATVILPFLLVSLPAFLLAHLGLGAQPLFLKQLDIMGLGYKIPPMERELGRTGVLALMHSNLVSVRPNLPQEEMLDLLKSAPDHYLLMPVAEGQQLISLHSDFTDHNSSPLSRSDIPGVPDTATLAEVYQLLAPDRRGMVYIYHQQPDCPIGLISWPMLYNYARSSQS